MLLNYMFIKFPAFIFIFFLNVSCFCILFQMINLNGTKVKLQIWDTGKLSLDYDYCAIISLVLHS